MAKTLKKKYYGTAIPAFSQGGNFPPTYFEPFCSTEQFFFKNTIHQRCTVLSKEFMIDTPFGIVIDSSHLFVQRCCILPLFIPKRLRSF